MTWKPRGSNRDVSPGRLRNLERKRFKARGELMTFACRHPGALSGHFLAMAHGKIAKGVLKETKQLREASVSTFVTQNPSKEVRDQRELLTVAAAIDAVNRNDLAEALDLLVQRLLAIQMAKKDGGGGWAKAEALELVGSTSSSAGASSVLRLAA